MRPFKTPSHPRPIFSASSGTRFTALRRTDATNDCYWWAISTQARRERIAPWRCHVQMPSSTSRRSAGWMRGARATRERMTLLRSLRQRRNIQLAHRLCVCVAAPHCGGEAVLVFPRGTRAMGVGSLDAAVGSGHSVRLLGIDGCKGGWVVAEAPADLSTVRLLRAARRRVVPVGRSCR